MVMIMMMMMRMMMMMIIIIIIIILIIIINILLIIIVIIIMIIMIILNCIYIAHFHDRSYSMRFTTRICHKRPYKKQNEENTRTNEDVAMRLNHTRLVSLKRWCRSMLLKCQWKMPF